MKLSARNQLKGTIKEIEEGAVNAVVKIDIGGGNVIYATISMDAVKSLGLSVGKEACAVIKSTSVMLYPASRQRLGSICVADGCQYAIYFRADLQRGTPKICSISSKVKTIRDPS